MASIYDSVFYDARSNKPECRNNAVVSTFDLPRNCFQTSFGAVPPPRAKIVSRYRFPICDFAEVSSNAA